MGKQTTQLCKGCGKAFTAYTRKGKLRRFCSHPCYGTWLSEQHQEDSAERDAENRSWRGFSDDERALHG